MSTADEGFLRFKSRHVLMWTLRNLSRLHEHPSAMCMNRPLDGRTVFVVGAGYSLQHNVGLLQDAQDKGAPIITVNAGDSILRKAGIVPDAMVIRESLIHDDTIDASDCPLIVADIGAHHATWTAAGKRLAWFVPGYPHLFDVSRKLRVRPCYGGSSALTTAVALALHWGAERIVLVGVDLCLTECADGRWRGYHPDAPRGGMSARLIPDPNPGPSESGWLLKQSGNEADDARCERSGQKPQPSTVSCTFLPSSDWGRTVPALETLTDQRTWLQTQAERHGARVDLLNASTGAGIVGWRQVDLSEAIGMMRVADPVHFEAPRSVSRAEVRALLDALKAGARSQLALSQAMLAPGGPPNIAHLMAPIAAWSPIAEALSIWRTLDGPEDPAEHLTITYEAMKIAAQEALEILEAA